MLKPTKGFLHYKSKKKKKKKRGTKDQSGAEDQSHC